jgi:glycine/D-amino acid oxidase-like deaminating enzyme
MRFGRNSEPRTGYDAIVVGAGAHGLATAYYLAERHGMTDVAVLERRAALNHVASEFARGAAVRGVDLITNCTVTEILTHRGRVAGVETTRGCIEAPRVALATGGHTSALTELVGLRLPLDGLFIDCGWGTGGLEAAPSARWQYAETIATGALIEHAVAAVAH